MNKLLLILFSLLAYGCFDSVSYAQKVFIRCPPHLNDISDCPNTGCGNVDQHLNRQKNIRSSNRTAEAMTIQQIRDLDDPVKGFEEGNTREEIRKQGEGKKIIVV